ncbi:oligosaccharide flippase family protein [Dellaglioa algida]|uniref:oligosaccharide flippase family protein n=1 Tax=Dellaglioa algida TaxID=105612 RepID=UPI0024C48E80|nr:oligosaccharide flippase family protein [Dellaglioa algida]MDK1724755.1 oligosaccharide flippase family protein [Dellaglioa algida]MDK1738705.1 oligosaccharide flippase family protein [Dellaglioa algida]
MDSIKKNFFYNTLYQLMIVIIPIVTTPYVTRTLGANSLGLYGYTAAIAGYFMLCSRLGFENHGNRSIAKARVDGSVSRTFWSVFFLQIFIGIIVIIAYVIFVVFVFRQHIILMLTQGLILFGTMIDVSWLFMGLERFSIIILRNTIVKLITIGSIFIFVQNTQDTLVYALIITFGQVIGFLIVLPYLKSLVKFYKPTNTEVLSQLKPILKLAIPLIAISMFTILDTVFVGLFSNNKQVAFYNMATSILAMPKSIIGALGVVMLPRIANFFAESDGSSRKDIFINPTIIFITIYSFGAMFGLIGVSKVLAPVFLGPQFQNVSSLIVIMAFILPIYSWGNMIRTQILIPKSNDRPYIISVILGAIINICLNVFLIPYYGSLGAVIAILVTEYTLAIYVMWSVRHDIIFKNYFSISVYFIFNGVLMAIIIRAVGNLLGNHIITLIIQLITGIIVYGIFSFIYLRRSNNKILSGLRLKLGKYEIFNKKI